MAKTGKTNWVDTPSYARIAGRKLDSLLYKKRIRQKDFANALGVTPRTLYDFRFKGIHDIDVVGRAAELLGVELQSFFVDDEEGSVFILTFFKNYCSCTTVSKLFYKSFFICDWIVWFYFFNPIFGMNYRSLGVGSGAFL